MPDTPEILFDAFISNTTPGATRPKVVTLSDGNMLVAYATEEGGAPGIDIRGQLFDPAGTPIGGWCVAAIGTAFVAGAVWGYGAVKSALD